MYVRRFRPRFLQLFTAYVQHIDSKLLTMAIYMCSLFGDRDLHLREISYNKTMAGFSFFTFKLYQLIYWLLEFAAGRPSTADECIRRH